MWTPGGLPAARLLAQQRGRAGQRHAGTAACPGGSPATNPVWAGAAGSGAGRVRAEGPRAWVSSPCACQGSGSSSGSRQDCRLCSSSSSSSSSRKEESKGSAGHSRRGVAGWPWACIAWLKVSGVVLGLCVLRASYAPPPLPRPANARWSPGLGVRTPDSLQSPGARGPFAWHWA